MTLTKTQLRQEYRLTACSDPWGDAMHWLFTIADHLHFNENGTPDAWQYRPSPLGPTNDPDDYVTGLCAETDAETLTDFGNVLSRYAEKLRLAGLDY